MMRAVARPLLALACAVAAVPAAAAPQPFPKPIEAEFDAAKSAMMQDPREALGHVGRAEKLAGTIRDPRQHAMVLATARWLTAEARLRNNEPEAAEPLLAEALRLIAPIPYTTKLKGDLLMSQGSLYMDRDQAALALANYQEAFRIFVDVKQPRSQAIALQNMALLYLAANDNASAEQKFAQAAAAFDGDPMLSLSLHNNRGAALLVLERYAEAEAEYRKALDIAQKNGNALLQARILGNIARTLVEARKLDAAESTLKRGFELAKGNDATGFRQQLLATAARVAMERGDWQRARRLISEAFDGVDLATTTTSYRDAHRFAFMIFSHVGEPARALQHLEALKRLDDEAAKVATTTGASLATAKFNFALQDLKIEKLRAEELRKGAEFQRTLFLAIGGATLAIILLLTIALFVIRRSRNQVRAANVVLGETNVALEKALRAKTEFLATTSHEIRTPLNGILGMTQVMLADPKLGADTRDRIGIVHGAGVTMRALVDDILDLAKMETGNLTVEAAAMNLPAVLRDVTRMWEEQARAKGLGFALDLDEAPVWITSDPGRLRQIVFNLLSNAIKFTERGTVGVRATAEGEGEARRLRLAVRDSGIGIPADKLEEIFESFKQADSGTTRKFGGTGLGLTICRNLAQALGGDILVESAEGEGSRFIVDLPLVPAEAPAGSAAEAAGTGTLLILDRNPIARAMLKTLLEPRVGALRFFATAEDTVAALAGGATQLLVDEATLKAQEGDPFAILGELAAAAREAGAGSAVLWLNADEAVRGRIAEAGIGQVIDKPVNGPALIGAVVSETKENSDAGASSALVSRAA